MTQIGNPSSVHARALAHYERCRRIEPTPAPTGGVVIDLDDEGTWKLMVRTLGENGQRDSDAVFLADRLIEALRSRALSVPR